MAEKISKIVITVDLSCRCCSKKVQKVLCKLQEQGQNITNISYDEKKNTVTVSGPFDPHKLSKKLWCKACKVIKSIDIVPDKPKESSPPKNPCEVINNIKIVVCDPPKCPSPLPVCPDCCCKPPECICPPPEHKPCSPKEKPVPCPPPVCPDCRCKPPKCTCPPPEHKPCSSKKKPVPCPPPVCPDCCCKPPKCTCPPPEHKPCSPKPTSVACPPPICPDCCYKPCYMDCHGGCRSCSCGKVDGCGGCGRPICCGTCHGVTVQQSVVICEEYSPAPCTMM
uniref:Protein PYRICULARIA ORYZAE RESISTANCE 21-like n=1 Tax=Elaeis guineensis var. tenera TaxID=51953 RepID=A0A8N4IC24_ELAGV|nr:protein PYRICULARIA ORYZAE RESISTANCE 21-like [Elaeis guineensis]